MQKEGKHVILITGSARGIGAATARLAVDSGWRIILHGRTESPALRDLAHELDAPMVVADVRDQSEIHAAVQKAYSTYNRLDALVNAAGIVTPKPFLDLAESDFENEYRVNVLGTCYACQAAIPLMQGQKTGGRIVNVSSIRGLFPMASFRGVNYSMTKAAIVNLTESLAKGLAPAVAVNAVAPGFTETDMAKTWNDQVWTQAKSSLLGRPGKPSEIASAILFLASPAASFMTGQTLLVDGGYALAGK